MNTLAKNAHFKQARALAIAAAMVSPLGAAAAQLINVDFGGQAGSATGAAVLSGYNDFWNTIGIGNTTLYNATSGGGAYNSTGTSLVMTGWEGLYGGAGYGVSGLVPLTGDYVYDTNNSASLAINGLTPGETYTWVIYTNQGGGGRPIDITVDGTTKSSSNTINRTTLVEGVNYLTFTGVVPGSGTLTANFAFGVGNAGEMDINGFQLQLVDAVGGNDFQQDSFVFGTYYDPDIIPDDASLSLSNLLRAKSAGFNLLLGIQGFSKGDMESSTRSLSLAHQAGMKCLALDDRFFMTSFSTHDENSVELVVNQYKTLPTSLRGAMYGYNLGDEPEDKQSAANNTRNWIDDIKNLDAGMLAHVNLLPRYGFTTDGEYEAYLDKFIDQTSPGAPDIISFDSYPFRIDGSFRPDFFYNLRVINQKSAGRPFWAYVMSLKENAYRDSGEAELRFLSACPLAYGAKGLVYYTYESPKAKLLIDYMSDGAGRFGNSSYGGNTACQPAMADYDGDGKTDYSIKTDDGTWHIDFSGNGFNSWDVEFSGYGGTEAHAVPTDYDGDGKADLAVKTDDGRWLIDYADNGFGSWDLVVNGIGGTEAHAVPADYDGDGKADLAVKTDDGRWLIDYANIGFGSWDLVCNGVGGPEAFPVPADYDGDGKADLAVKADDGRWLIDYAVNGHGAWDTVVNGYPTDNYGTLQGDSTTAIFNPGYINRIQLADLDKTSGNNNGYADFRSLIANLVPGQSASYTFTPAGNSFFGTLTVKWSVWIDFNRDGDFGDPGELIVGPTTASGSAVNGTFTVPADASVGASRMRIAMIRSSTGQTSPTGSFSNGEVEDYSVWIGVNSTPSGINTHPVQADYDGDGLADLALKTDDGRWRIDYATGGFGSWDVLASGYGGGDTRGVRGDFDGDGKSDIAVLTGASHPGGTGLIDYSGNPTSKYSFAANNNHFISQVVAPIVFGCTWKGAYHASATPAGIALNAGDMIAASDTISAASNPDYLVAHFADQANPMDKGYYLVVNKSLDAAGGGTLSLKGRYGSVSIGPAMKNYAGSTSYQAVATAYDPASDTSTFPLPALAGGEARMVSYASSTASDFDIWRASHGVTGGLSDDEDHDGQTNFQEFAFGLNPRDGSSINPVSIQSMGAFRYTRRKPTSLNPTYTYEYSTTLLNDSWNPFTPASENSNGGEPVEEITATLPATLMVHPRLFLRIRANQ
jgi:hypothetical protein